MVFSKDDIELIKAGSKSQARFLGYYPAVKGDLIAVRDQHRRKDPEAVIRITGIRKEKLGDIKEADCLREGFYSLEEFREAWRERHKSRGGWTPDERVLVMSFKLVN